jgi:phosphatidylglycerophosphate synthase
VPRWLLAAVIGKDLWLTTGFLVGLLFTVRLTITPNACGKLSTFGQFALVGAVLLTPELEAARLGRLADLLVAAVAILTVVATVVYTAVGLRALADAELAGPVTQTETD